MVCSSVGAGGIDSVTGSWRGVAAPASVVTDSNSFSVAGVAVGPSEKACGKPKGSSVASTGAAGAGTDAASPNGTDCERGDDADETDRVNLSKGLLLFMLVAEGLVGSGETGRDAGKG
jgi:hypothetical protein